jgi:sRNA-binding protein
MRKAWTADKGPILATELEVKRADAIRAMLIRPIDVLPAAPGDPIRPFAIGLFDEIKSLLKPDLTISKLRRATAGFVYSRRYYLACAQPDAKRHDLAGAVVGDVNEEDRLSAQHSFLSLQSAHGKPKKPPERVIEDKSSRIRVGLLPRKTTMAR